MTITAQPPAPAAGRGPGACRYRGCPNPARDSGAPGRRPGYCEMEVPEDRDGTAVLVRHTALTAFRRRQQLTGQPGEDRPVTAAISRADAIRDDALTAMNRLGAQLAAALDQLAALGEQLSAAGPEAAEAQAEAVHAETAARLEHARAETAGHAAARHAAELDAAEARAAAAEAVAMLEEHAVARARAGEAALEAARALEGERAAHAAELAAARDAGRRHEQERQRHDDALAAANATVTALREQLARAEAALDRERDRQRETTVLLRGLIPARTAPPRRPAAAGSRPRSKPRRFRAGLTARPEPPPATRKGNSFMTMTSPVSPDLKRLLRALKLGQLEDTLPERLALARQQKMAHADFLELLLSDEVTRRENGSAARRARTAGLYRAMRLETWDPGAAVRYDQQLWNELASLRFADAGHGALILGPVGVGKTHLATALGHIAVRRRLPATMARAGHLFKKLKAARLDNSTEAEHRRLAAVNVLIIDDFALQPLDELAIADFYELIVARHRKNPTIVTSNRTPVEWVTLMNDPLLAQSAVDRLVSTCHELIVEGESYRRRQRPAIPAT